MPPRSLVCMAQTAHLPIYKASYDLCLYLEQVVREVRSLAPVWARHGATGGRAGRCAAPRRSRSPESGQNFEGSSIASLGEVVYTCTPEGLVRISLRNSRWEAAQLPCQAVMAYGGLLLVMLSLEDPLFWSVFPGASFSYPDYTALLGGRFDASYDLGLGSTRMTVQGDTFYGAWHSTDTLNLVDLPSGGAVEPLQLDSYGDWVLGMSVTNDSLLAISGPDWGQTVALFDAHTGSRLRELRLARPAIGLACVTRR